MTKAIVTIADRFSSDAQAWLKSHAFLDVSDRAVPERLAETEGLIVRSQTKITRQSLATMPRLKAIATATAGFDHIDIAACAERGIRLAYSPLAHTQPAAELTWALVLACARRLKAADLQVREGEWDRDALTGLQLSGQTYGVVGLGRIGRTVAALAKAFGMRVVAYDPHRERSYFAECGTEQVGLDELFHFASVISLHVPLTRETRGLIHRERLRRLSADSIVVNTSRGGVINEGELLEHLRGRGPGMFALDVYATEPLPVGSGLLEFPQILLTPHIGAQTQAAFTAVSFEAARNLVALMAGETVQTPLPPKEEWYHATSHLA